MYCAICFGSGSQGQWTALYCGHVFHHACIQQSFNVTGEKCPHCRERKKGPKGELFFKLFIDDDPHGGSETQVPADIDEDDPIRLRSKIERLNARIEAMTQTIEEERAQANRDHVEIAKLKLLVQRFSHELEETSARLQNKINEYNSTAAQNKRLQNEYASAKLNLERERAANSRARLAFDTSISSRELSAQLAFLGEGGHSPPDYFQKLLEARNKALTEANSRVHKAEAARLTAENSAKEESRKLKLQIHSLKSQIEEYQKQVDTLRQQQQQQQPSGTTNNRKRSAPPSWPAYEETEDAAAATTTGAPPAANRPKQSHQRQPNPNFLGGAGVPPNRLAQQRRPNPPRVPAFDLGSEIDGLLGPSSELPDMRPPVVPQPQRMNDPAPAPVPATTAPVVDAQPPLHGAPEGISSDAAGEKPRPSILELRKWLLERKQAEAAAAAAAPAVEASAPVSSAAASGLRGNNSNSGVPIEWGTEVENAAADVDEEDDVIELISDSEEEDDNTATASGAPPQGIENDPHAINNNSNSNQSLQQRPPSKATISFLAAGPSKIALASAPGTSFIRDPKFATTGLKDDATFIHTGPDGKGGRTTYYRGQQSQQNRASGSSRPAPAWGATMKDHVGVNRGAVVGGSGSRGGAGKRGKGAGAGATVPISNYFGRSNSKPSE